MKTEYNGIEITYVEGSDNWHFDLRGRSRIADSLMKAKEAIDKEPKEKRAQTFPRFDVYVHSYSDSFKVATVTSLAEDAYHQGASFWTTGPEGRRKEKDYSLFPVNDHNTALVKQIASKVLAKEAIDEQIRALRKQLEIAKAPAELAA